MFLFRMKNHLVPFSLISAFTIKARFHSISEQYTIIRRWLEKVCVGMKNTLIVSRTIDKSTHHPLTSCCLYNSQQHISQVYHSVYTIDIKFLSTLFISFSKTVKDCFTQTNPKNLKLLHRKNIFLMRNFFQHVLVINN